MVSVNVYEKKTGKRVAVVPVVLGMMGGSVSEADFIKEAWRCALEDNLVSADGFDEYTFQIKDAK